MSKDIQISNDGFGGDFTILKGTELVVSEKAASSKDVSLNVSIRVKKPLKVKASVSLEKTSIKIPKLLTEILESYKIENVECELVIPNYSIVTKTKSVSSANAKPRVVQYNDIIVLLQKGKIIFNKEKIKVCEKSLKNILKKVVTYSPPVNDAC